MVSLGNVQASAQSGVATAQSEAQSDASHGNAAFIADSAASPLPAHSPVQMSTAEAEGARSYTAQPIASLAAAQTRQDAEPESSRTSPAGTKRKAEHAFSSPRSDSPTLRAPSMLSVQHKGAPASSPPRQQACGPGYEALPPQHPDLITPHSLPHCELPSTKRAASAANSVEAVQQDGDDEVVGSRRAFGGVVSLPAAYNARHQRTAQSRQRPDASTSTPMTSRQPAADLLEHRHSVVYDSESQRDSNHNTQQQPEASLQPASQASKDHKGGSPSNSQPPSQPQMMPSLSPECSAASQGLVDAGRVSEACQAAPDATQQATIQEASSCQRYDEEASQPLQGSADSHAHTALLSAPPHASQPSPPFVAGEMQDANAGSVQHAADRFSMHTALSDAAAGGQQPQMSASNDGLHLQDSSGQQHAPASVNAHGTVVEEEVPISDAETDLSSVGLRHSAQGSVELMASHALLPAAAAVLQAGVGLPNQASSKP